MCNTKQKYKLTKYACYYTSLTNSAAFALPPILFLIFRESFSLSFTMLGSLVLINFVTQLVLDLIFTFFSSRFNTRTCLKLTPLVSTLGLALYAILPTLFPSHAFLGLAAGTVVFSVSAGLCEVLLSPTVAAIPSDTPDRDMSALHSLYAWGVVSVVVLSTLFLKLFGNDSWKVLTLIWAAFPIVSFILFCSCPLPESISSGSSGGSVKGRMRGLLLCFACIFLGGATENTMTNWISGYLETGLGISKTVGDILGMAAFALFLGIGRAAYAKRGKNITRVLFLGMLGSIFTYVTAGLSPVPVLSVIACVITGLTTSMLWPGTLIMMEEHYPSLGIGAYALMAAGGDLGASLAPQHLGMIVDKISAFPRAVTLAKSLDISPEQIGLRSGMLFAALFPILGALLLAYIMKQFKKGK
jgi:MFS family permease